MQQAVQGRRSRAQRRGTAMLLFVLLVTVMMGIAALVIDLGVASLTQVQMQSAADGVAMEALRERDLARDTQTASNPFARDRKRRVLNGPMASWPFMERLGASSVPYTDGAGAYFQMGVGQGTLNANAPINLASTSVPILETNYEYDAASGSITPLNKRNGDIVSGEFKGHDDVDGDGEPEQQFYVGFDGNPFHLENGLYQRQDFDAADPQQAPFGNSMLVRLRRTRHTFNSPWLVYDTEENVASSGPTLPLLFGKGTTIQGANPQQEYSIRHQGLTVRATAIAEARRAIRVGPGLLHVNPGSAVASYRIGIAPIAIWKEFWQEEILDLWWMTDVDGNRYVDFAIEDSYYFWVGNAQDQATGFFVPRSIRMVGERLPWPPDPSEDPENDWDTAFWESPLIQECYAPIYRQRSVLGVGTVQRIIGFARVRIETATEVLPDGTVVVKTANGRPMLRMTKLRNELAPGRAWVAPRNASAVFNFWHLDRNGDGQVGLNEQERVGLRDFTDEQWAEIFEELENLDGAIRAPALVR